MSYIFTFCFLLTQQIHFPLIYPVSFHSDRSYIHKFPQNIYFFAFWDKLLTLCTQKTSSEDGELIATYPAVEESRS